MGAVSKAPTNLFGRAEEDGLIDAELARLIEIEEEQDDSEEPDESEDLSEWLESGIDWESLDARIAATRASLFVEASLRSAREARIAKRNGRSPEGGRL